MVDKTRYFATNDNITVNVDGYLFVSGRFATSDNKVAEYLANHSQVYELEKPETQPEQKPETKTSGKKGK